MVWRQEPASMSVWESVIALAVPDTLSMPLQPVTLRLPAVALAVMVLGRMGSLKLLGRVSERSIVVPLPPPSRPPLADEGAVALINKQLLARQAGSLPWLICETCSVICLNWLLASS